MLRPKIKKYTYEYNLTKLSQVWFYNLPPLEAPGMVPSLATFVTAAGL